MSSSEFKGLEEDDPALLCKEHIITSIDSIVAPVPADECNLQQRSFEFPRTPSEYLGCMVVTRATYDPAVEDESFCEDVDPRYWNYYAVEFRKEFPRGDGSQIVVSQVYSTYYSALDWERQISVREYDPDGRCLKPELTIGDRYEARALECNTDFNRFTFVDARQVEDILQIQAQG